MESFSVSRKRMSNLELKYIKPGNGPQFIFSTTTQYPLAISEPVLNPANNMLLTILISRLGKMS